MGSGTGGKYLREAALLHVVPGESRVPHSRLQKTMIQVPRAVASNAFLAMGGTWCAGLVITFILLGAHLPPALLWLAILPFSVSIPLRFWIDARLKRRWARLNPGEVRQLA